MTTNMTTKLYSMILLISALTFIAFSVNSVNAADGDDDEKTDDVVSDRKCIFQHFSDLFKLMDELSSASKPEHETYFQSYTKAYNDPAHQNDVKYIKNMTGTTLALYVDTFVGDPPSGDEAQEGTDEGDPNSAEKKITDMILKVCRDLKADTANCSQSVREPMFLRNNLEKLYKDLADVQKMAAFENDCGKVEPEKR